MPVAISQDELDRRKQEDSKEPDTPVVEVDSRPVAKRVLVRGSDGRLHVQFVDVRTGKRIPDTKISKYRFTSANESKWTPTKNTGTDTDTKGTKSDEPQTKTIRLVDGRTKEVPLDWDGPGYTSSKNSVNKENNYTPQGLSKSRETSNTSRSADMNSGADTKTTNTTSAGKDADNSDIGDNGEDISFAKPTNDNFAVKDQNNVTGTNPAVANTVPVVDVPTGFEAPTEVNPIQGQDLSKVTTMTAQRQTYSERDIEAMAKTLAGEIDQRYTDIDSDIGKQEIGAILSTMETRAASTGDSIFDTVYKPNQYSAHNAGARKTTAANYAIDPEGWKQKVKDHLAYPTSYKPYSHYRNPSLRKPKWAAHEVNPVKIGPHQFSTLDTGEYSLPKGFLDGFYGTDMATGINAQRDYTPDTSLATGINAQRDYTPDTSLAAGMNAQRDFTPDSSMAAGMNAQRDYTGDNTGFTTADVDKSSRFSTPSIAPEDMDRFNAPSVNDQANATNFDQGMNAQRDYTGDDTGFTTADVDKSSRFAPTDVSQTRMPGYNESNETSFAAGMNAQRNEIDSGLVDGLNDIGVTDKTTRDGFTAGDIQKSSRFSTPSIAPEDMDRFNAPSVNDQINSTNFDQGMQAQRDYTNTGFGDYVKEDQSVTAPSTFGVTPTGNINNTVDSSWTNSASSDISSSPPSFAGIQNEADAAKDTGMNSETNSHTTDGVSDTGPSRDGEGFSGEPGGEAPGTTPGGTTTNEGSDGFSTNTNTGESKPDTGVTTDTTGTDTDSESNGGSGGGFTSGDDGIGGWDGYF